MYTLMYYILSYVEDSIKMPLSIIVEIFVLVTPQKVKVSTTTMYLDSGPHICNSN